MDRVDLELVVIGGLGVLLCMHLWLARVHSGRIRQLDADMDMIDGLDVSDEMHEESINCARMHAQAVTAHHSNRRTVTVYTVCFTGLAIMSLLNVTGLVADPMSWTSLLIVPLPAYLTIDHLRTSVLPFKWKCRSLVGAR